MATKIKREVDCSARDWAELMATCRSISATRRIVEVIETLARAANGDASQTEVLEAYYKLSSITLGDMAADVGTPQLISKSACCGADLNGDFQLCEKCGKSCLT